MPKPIKWVEHKHLDSDQIMNQTLEFQSTSITDGGSTPPVVKQMQITTPPQTPKARQGQKVLTEHPNGRLPYAQTTAFGFSSPYDPSKTPQFIHTRPPEPIENALRFPMASDVLSEQNSSTLKIEWLTDESDVVGVEYLNRCDDNGFLSMSGSELETPMRTSKYMGDTFSCPTLQSSTVFNSGELLPEEGFLENILSQVFNLSEACTPFL
jgi:hypothetical protein